MWPILLAALIAPTVHPDDAQAVAFRFRPKVGHTYAFDLTVERERPRSVGTFRIGMRVTRVQANVVTTEFTIPGMRVDGQDRSERLRAMLDGGAAVLEWTPLATRTGNARGFVLRRHDPDLEGFFAEAGIYLCQFPPNPVRPGDAWSGSTTATGGCTSARYRYGGLEQGRALFELTDVRMADHEQVGPMTMAVDPRTGIPIRVEYRARRRPTGRVSRFVQTLVGEDA